MRPPDEPDPALLDRLAVLGLGGVRGGWVPDRPGVPAPDEPRRQAVEGSAPPTRMRSWSWPSFDELAVAPHGRALLALAAVCAGCVVVTAWVLLHHRPAALAVAPPPAIAASPLPLPSASPTGIVVDVGGRVRRPGLVTLPPGARVADAVRAAGGAVRRSDLRLVNLAALVTDGQLLLIGVPGAAAGAAAPAGSGGAPAPVNLNTATVDQLDTLPGIGPVLAQRILDWRSAHGDFRSVADLNEVSGIGDAIFAEISPLVTV